MRFRKTTLATVLALGSGGVLTSLAMPGGVPSALGQNGGSMANQAAGIYSDASTAMQMSTFSMNPRMVTCGVGTVGGMGFTGPFAMMMYSLGVQSYKVDTATRTITATGRMRSITKTLGGLSPIGNEDATHDFTAIAVDKSGADRYDLHFSTPFWNSGNPMCTKSDVVPGGCRFGGDLLMGEVNVS